MTGYIDNLLNRIDIIGANAKALKFVVGASFKEYILILAGAGKSGKK